MMDTKKAHKQKSEAEFELMKAKLSVLKARAKVKIAQGRIEYAKDMEDLEKKVEIFNKKLKELGAVNEVAWSRLKENAETAWKALKTAVADLSEKLKG